jgi:hypothetical protein
MGSSVNTVITLFNGQLVQFPAGAKDFSLSHCICDGSGAHAATLLSNGYWSLFHQG